MFSSRGRLVYDPRMEGQKVVEPFWLILQCEWDLIRYYARLAFYEHCIVIMKPAWGPHISVIRSEEVRKKENWGKDAGKWVRFEYEPMVLSNGKHFWLPVRSRELSELRKSYGLTESPGLGFHLTLGNELEA